MASAVFPSGIPTTSSAHVPWRLANRSATILSHAVVWSWQRIFKAKKAHRHIPPCRPSCCSWLPDYSSKSASRPSLFIICINRGARPSFLLRLRRRQNLLNTRDQRLLLGVELSGSVEFL